MTWFFRKNNAFQQSDPNDDENLSEAKITNGKGYPHRYQNETIRVKYSYFER